MPTDTKKDIRLYADDRFPEGKEVIEYLMKNDILFSAIPTSGHVPILNVGMRRYDGFEEIKQFVARSKMKAIVVTKRSKDFHVCLEGKPEIWGAGANPQTALGNLISGHKEQFGISEIKYPRLKHFAMNLASRNAREKKGK